MSKSKKMIYMYTICTGQDVQSCDAGPVTGTAAGQFQLLKEPGCGGGAAGEERSQLVHRWRGAGQTHHRGRGRAGRGRGAPCPVRGAGAQLQAAGGRNETPAAGTGAHTQAAATAGQKAEGVRQSADRSQGAPGFQPTPAGRPAHEAWQR